MGSSLHQHASRINESKKVNSEPTLHLGPRLVRIVLGSPSLYLMCCQESHVTD